MKEMDLRAILGGNIRRLRLVRRLSQMELAEKVDISIPFLSDIENGKKWVSPATLARLASSLEVHAYEFLKPETVIPDRASAILEKYTDDILSMVSESLEKLRDGYLQQLEGKRSEL